MKEKVIGVALIFLVIVATYVTIYSLYEKATELQEDNQSYVGKHILKGKDTLEVLYFIDRKGMYRVQDGTLVSKRFIKHTLLEDVKSTE